MDYAEVRRKMVDGQLRPSRVTDPRILSAMGELPRERFMPPALAARAYTDEDVALPDGRAVMEPLVIARLIQMLALREDERLLLIGAGTGYGAAVAARVGARVTALEEDAGLVTAARAALGQIMPSSAVRVVHGPLTEGHAAGAPYDAILIEGEIPEIPASISGQLAEGGRLATVLAAAQRGRSSRAVLGQRLGGVFTVSDVFDCAVAPLPAFLRQPGFVF
ncbi:MAG TPA: protein-L-isoaspartate O-methyltransferase [Acetobacteraceae bacterium]|jgi:protein-L-isoaspartate(D-aspartate) O-methyltransferase|nr:protein-L-isoaspartate O-methyltransferase [Acetobacteraceae bacterium]